VSQSLTLLAAGVEEAESQTHRLALVDLLRVQGQALAQSGDDEAAQDRFSRALALARSMRYPYKEALALQAWARAYPADPAARQRLAEAREIFERLGAHRDVAHSS
jgi:hypothetical protein